MKNLAITEPKTADRIFNYISESSTFLISKNA